MKRGVSTYLDMIRAVAALEVFLAHFRHGIPSGWLSFFGSFGHQAVVIFFVISGYVIAYVSTERETDLGSYAISRASRIYSVAIPALIATAAIDVFLQSRGVDLGDSYQLEKPWEYVPLFLAFGTDWWFINESAFSDMPYWSLCYEGWYYALFAAWRYFTGRKRILLCAAILLLVGPRSWLLFPLWLSGVWLYHFHARSAWSSGIARAMWGLSLAGVAWLLLSGACKALNDAPYLIVGDGVRVWLRFSQYFLGDYALAALIALNVAALPSCGLHFGRLEGPIRYMANLSFALYLFHYPLLELFSQWLSPLPLAIAVLASVWGLGIATESLRLALRGAMLLARPQSAISIR